MAVLRMRCLESRPASRSVRIAPPIDDVIIQRRVTAPRAADSFRSSIDTQHLSRSSCRARELPVVDRGKTQTRWSGISTVSSHLECAVHAKRRVEIQLHLFLASAPDVCEWSRSRSGLLTLETESLATGEEEAWWNAEPVWAWHRREKAPSVSEPRTVQPAYTG